MFIGEFTHNIDTKGRMAIPAKFRNELKRGAVVTRGLDNCLFLYSREAWEKIATKLANLPISQAKARAFSRMMLAGAMDVTIDKQGRINLPDYLCKYAGLKRTTIVAGLYDRLEIWDEAAWQKYNTTTERQSNSIAEALGELGV